jgi:hypothetical protein
MAEAAVAQMTLTKTFIRAIRCTRLESVSYARFYLDEKQKIAEAAFSV